MFRFCIILTILLGATDYAFSCFSVNGQPKEFSEWEKNWCRQDLNRCAWYLCRQQGGFPCNDNSITIEIMPILRCHLYDECQPRTDRLGYACYKNKDCMNSNYRCYRGRCVHKSTLPVQIGRCYFDGECPNNAYRCINYQCVLKNTVPSGCYYDSECPNSSYRCFNGQCVLKNDVYEVGGRCEASPDCPQGYKCKGFRCVPGKGSQPKSDIPTTCNASPDCAKGYTCKGFKCVPGKEFAGKIGRYCEEFNTECGNVKLRCDKSRHVCYLP